VIDNNSRRLADRARRRPDSHDPIAAVALVRRTVAYDRSPRWSDERTENCTGQQELEVCWEASRAVPTVVEEVVSSRTQEREDVLEVRGRARGCAERRGIERSTPQGEEGETRQTAADLEPTRADVLVRDAVADKMEDRSREERREPRPTGCARRCAGRHVERDDHWPFLSNRLACERPGNGLLAAARGASSTRCRYSGRGSCHRLMLSTMFAAAAAMVTAAPVSAEADNVVVAGYGRLATGALVGVDAVSTRSASVARCASRTCPGSCSSPRCDARARRRLARAGAARSCSALTRQGCICVSV
jgi:hypothetical protein